MDPATGETLWTFREPETIRHQRSPRQAYGKGVTYGEINGRGVIYITTPGFFLWALDAKTGRPLEDWGGEFPVGGILTPALLISFLTLSMTGGHGRTTW